MTSKKSVSALILAAIMVLFAFAGCGSSASAQPAEAATSAAAESTASEAEAPAADASDLGAIYDSMNTENVFISLSDIAEVSSDEPVKIGLAMGYGVSTPFYKSLADAFMEEAEALGRVVYALGGNEEAVRLSGLNVSRWRMVPYLYSGLCCGITGVLLTARLSVGAPTSGINLEADAIAAVIVGGTSFNGGIGTVSGAIIGVFIMGIINNILDLMNVMAYPQMMLKGVIMVAAVVLSTIRDKSRQ